MKKILVLILLLSFSPYLFAKALIDVTPKTIEFSKETKRNQFITVKNTGDAKAYIGIFVYNAEKPRHEQSQKDTLKRSFKVIISPRKMILRPNQSKRVRITNLDKKLKQDRVIDIVIDQIVPNKNKALTATEGGLGVRVQGSILRIVRVYIRPDQINADLQYKVINNKQSKEILLSNTGNTSINLVKGQACQANNQCQSLAPITLFPGTHQNIFIPKKSTYVEFGKKIAHQVHILKITTT